MESILTSTFHPPSPVPKRSSSDSVRAATASGSVPLGQSPNPQPVSSAISLHELNAEPDDPSTVPLSTATTRRLYVSHFFTSWGDRLYDFSSYLFIIAAFPGTLVVPSLFGLLSTLASILFTPSLGARLDTTPRLTAVRAQLVTGKSATILASAAFYALLTWVAPETRPDSAASDGGTSAYLLFATIVVLSVVRKLAFTVNTLSIEKDWVPCIAHRSPVNLTRLNSTMRRIDLVSNICAPLMVGFIATLGASTVASVVFVGAWNAATWPLEYWCVWSVFQSEPVLAAPKVSRSLDLSESTSTGFSAQARRWVRGIASAPGRAWASWRRYATHSMFLASLSMAILYLTVISFDGITVSYLKWAGHTDVLIAGMRGISVACGLSATFIMPPLSRRIGVMRTATWGVWGEVASLVPVVLSFFLPVSPTWSSAMLFAGISISRLGLWTFDLAQTQLMQQGVEPNAVGEINGWQAALCNVASIAAYGVTIGWGRPEEFRWPVAVSFCAVVLAAIVMSWHLRRERGHLVHLEKLKLR